MGLDMYLYAEVSSVHHAHGDNEPSPEHVALVCAATELGLQDNAGEGNYGHVSIERQAGYWRKANAIHNWFVTNVQDGVDECQRSYVNIAQLTALREVCQRVLEVAVLEKGEPETLKDWKGNDYEHVPITITNPDAIVALLPPTSGFFFGTTDVDEWFLDDVKHAIAVVKSCEALSERHGSRARFHYQSSW